MCIRDSSLGSGACLLAAILGLSIMVLPSIINVSETALRAVPREYEEASLALGATAAETYFRVSLHAAPPKTWGCFAPLHPDVLGENMGMFWVLTPIL